MREPDAEPAGLPMPAYETLRTIERHLFAEPGALLAEDVELQDHARSEVVRGREAVGSYLRRLRRRVANSPLTDLRLTVDEGRVAAEWVYVRHVETGEEAVPMAGVYEVTAGRVAAIRLYYDPTALPTVEDRTSFTSVERLPDEDAEKEAKSAAPRESARQTQAHRLL